MKKYGNVISVYRFMDLCGLWCEKKERILISHEIMLRKIILRHSKFPEEVLLPKRLPTYCIKKEELCNGHTVLVEDDYGLVLPYHLVRKLSVVELNEEESMEIRKKLIEEELTKEKDELPLGYQKYLYKKNKKELEAEKEAILALLKEDYNDLQVTEHINRYQRLLERRN